MRSACFGRYHDISHLVTSAMQYLLVAIGLAFAPLSERAMVRSMQPRQQPAMMAKGFGTPKATPKAKAAPKPQSAGAVARDKAASDLEKLKATGVPEYMVLIRECPEGEQPGKWYPVGGLAVPRSSSIDVALSMAIFNNEDDLLKGAFRSYPFLKKSEHKFEYGYRCSTLTNP